MERELAGWALGLWGCGKMHWEVRGRTHRASSGLARVERSIRSFKLCQTPNVRLANPGLAPEAE